MSTRGRGLRAHGGDAGLHQLGGAALGLVLDRGAAGPELEGPLGGGTAGAVLETASQANLQAALEPLLASDAVLVTDAGTGCPGCARSLGVQHEAVNRAAGSHPIQTVNQRHRQLQQFLLPFHGVATKCLGNYLRWHREIGLASQPSPRACLPASLAPQCTRFAN